MRYTVVRSNNPAEISHPPTSRKHRPPTEPEWDEANLWVEHDTIPDAELNSGVVSGEIEDDGYLP